VDNQDAEVIALIVEVIPQVDDDSTGSPSLTAVDEDAPSPSKSLTPTGIQSPVILQDVGNDNLDIEVAHIGNDPLLSEGPSAEPNRGSKRQKEGGEQASASTPSEKATKGAGGSTTGSQSRQMSASESTYAEEPVQTTCQMEETSHPVSETGADDQPIVQTSQHPEWFS
nr:hypothetical protein [Tanacetum cinerariifolium]